MDIIKSPQVSVEDYLYNDFNIQIYEDLTENLHYTFTFDPLEFFNKFYADFDFFANNAHRYLDIKKYFNALNLTDREAVFYFSNFFKLAKKVFLESEYNDEVIYKSIGIIETLYNEYCEKDGSLFKTAPPIDSDYSSTLEDKFDFEKVKKNISGLSEIKEKIIYLTEIVTEYKQEKGGYLEEISFGVTTFTQKCELEITKLKEILALEKQTTKNPKKEIVIKHEQPYKPQFGSFTQTQIIIVFYYFFKLNRLEIRTDIDVAPVAKFIHLLVGKEFKTIQNSDIYKKLSLAPDIKVGAELIKDLVIIKPFFEMVQLTEIVKMIDNDISIAQRSVKKKNKI